MYKTQLAKEKQHKTIYFISLLFIRGLRLIERIYPIIDFNMSQTFCNTRVEPEEELLQCPYDPVHRILPKRMQTHLIKCRKAILGQPTSPYYQRALDMVVCKFNSKHHVQKNELDAHHFKCPDKKEFFSNVATITDNDDPEKVPGWMKLIDDSALKKQPNGDEEDWEDEWQQTYDPMEKIKNQSLNHLMNGMMVRKGVKTKAIPTQRNMKIKKIEMGQKINLHWIMMVGRQ